MTTLLDKVKNFCIDEIRKPTFQSQRAEYRHSALKDVLAFIRGLENETEKNKNQDIEDMVDKAANLFVEGLYSFQASPFLDDLEPTEGNGELTSSEIIRLMRFKDKFEKYLTVRYTLEQTRYERPKVELNHNLVMQDLITLAKSFKHD
jgi:hypothetical protein